jgi:uncharacterized protein
MTLIDTSAFCGHWPFRRLPVRGTAEVKALLSAGGVTRAWVAPLEGVFYHDPMDANEELNSDLRGDEFFVQCGVINVTLASFHRDALACLDELNCGAIKLFPNYHGYDLADARVKELAALAAEENLPLCIQMRMQDERGHHPLVKVPGVPALSVVALAQACPQTRILACGPYLNEMKTLSGAPNIWCETSFAENGETLKNVLAAVAPGRLVFGSHSPMYYLAANVAKLNPEMAGASAEQVAAISAANAAALLGPA